MKALFEKLEQPDNSPFLLKEVVLPAFNVPFHFHPELELTLIQKSEGRRYVGDHVGKFGPGDLVFIGKNEPHFWQNTKHENGGSKAIIVQFEEHFLGKTFFTKQGMQHIGKLMQKAHRGIQIGGHSKKVIEEKLLAMFDLDPFEKVVSLLSILTIIASSNDLEYLASPGYKATFNQADCDRINAVCQYVSDHYTVEIDTSYVAVSVANMSTTAFCHYFKKRMNKTFTQFVNEVRVGEANQLLIHSNKDIAEIGYLCGYHSLSNFYKQFGQINHLSPKKYREKFKW
ncbi:MAG: AraC family transcriptional regulator [Saprospiraceae bacterium]|nr:MAG: AraC family transcriptional regulator [Saprospiraceae bacterium]